MAQDRGPTLSLKSEKDEGVSKTTCSMKEGVNEKPTKLSDKRVENKYVKSRWIYINIKNVIQTVTVKKKSISMDLSFF